jgi:hypothetical protein
MNCEEIGRYILDQYCYQCIADVADFGCTTRRGKIKEELTYTISVQAYLYGYTTMDLYRIFATPDGAALPKQELQAL